MLQCESIDNMSSSYEKLQADAQDIGLWSKIGSPFQLLAIFFFSNTYFVFFFVARA